MSDRTGNQPPHRRTSRPRTPGRSAPAARGGTSRGDRTRRFGPVRAGRPPAARATLRLVNPRRRLNAVLIAVAFVFSLFAGRLIQLQTLDGTQYAAAANADREEVITLHAPRGQILDAEGDPLASTVEAYDVTADPTQIANTHAHAATIAALLNRALGNPAAEEAVLRRQLSDTHTNYQVLARGITPATWDRIKQLDLIGVYGVEDSKRVYAPDDLASNVVGYVNGAGVGAGGIEMQYNTRLTGRDGSITEQAADGTEIPSAGVNERAPVPGSSVELTINHDIQWVAQQALAKEVKEARASGGTVIAEVPRTGQIVAMASYPTFDPNNITTADIPYLSNAAVTQQYEPGSVAKLMTVSAGINEGFVSPTNELDVPPCIHRANYCFTDDTPHGWEHLTVTGMLAYSSNIGAIMTADQFGPNRDQLLYDYFSKFGMGQPSGLNFPGESDGTFVKPSQWNPSQRYTIVFGQGFALTALQATSMVATIANGGVRVEPSLVKGFVSADGRFTPAAAPARRTVVSQHTASQVLDMMQAVVSSKGGTAPGAAIPGYLVGGKTGTANRYSTQCRGYCGYTASFADVAPADNPGVVVYVALQNPTNGHFGDLVAEPIANTVMKFALRALHVAPTGARPADLPITW